MADRQMPSSFDPEHELYREKAITRFFRRIRDEPLIPLGCVLTVGAFINAWRAMRRGDHIQVNKYFRYRVLAQGFTVAAICGGGWYYSRERSQERELWKLKREADSREKRQRWIRELEIRDEEDKAAHASLHQRRKRAGERQEAQERADALGDGPVMKGLKNAKQKAGEAPLTTAEEAAKPEEGLGDKVSGSLGSLLSRSNKAADPELAAGSDLDPREKAAGARIRKKTMDDSQEAESSDSKKMGAEAK